MATTKKTQIWPAKWNKGMKQLQDLGLLPSSPSSSFKELTGMEMAKATPEKVAQMWEKMFGGAVKVKADDLPDIADVIFGTTKIEDIDLTKMPAGSVKREAARLLRSQAVLKSAPGGGLVGLKNAVTALPEGVMKQKAKNPKAGASLSSYMKSMRGIYQEYALLEPSGTNTGQLESTDKAIGGESSREATVGDIVATVDATGAKTNAAGADDLTASLESAQQTAADPLGQALTGKTATGAQTTNSLIETTYSAESRRLLEEYGVDPKHAELWAIEDGEKANRNLPRRLKTGGYTVDGGPAGRARNPWGSVHAETKRELLRTIPGVKNLDEATSKLFQLTDAAAANGMKADMTERVHQLVSRAEAGENIRGELRSLLNRLQKWTKGNTARTDKAAALENLRVTTEEVPKTLLGIKGMPEDKSELAKIAARITEAKTKFPDKAAELTALESKVTELTRLTDLPKGLVGSAKRWWSNAGGAKGAAKGVGGALALGVAMGIVQKLMGNVMDSRAAERDEALLQAESRTAPEIINSLKAQEAMTRQAAGQSGMPDPRAAMLASMLMNSNLPTFRTAIGPSPEEQLRGKSPAEVIAMMNSMGV